MKQLWFVLLVFFMATSAFAAWETLPAMSEPRTDPMVAVDDIGAVYVFGGSNLSVYLSSAEMYAPDEGWANIAALPTDLAQGNAAFYEGKIFIAGGFNGSELVATLFVYDVDLDGWSTGGDAPEARYGYSLDLVEDKLYLIGGADGADVSQSNCWEYDFAADGWTVKTGMAQARRYHGSAVIEGKIYLFGGIDDSDPAPVHLSDGEVYDPHADTWSAIAAMPVTFWGGSAGRAEDAAWACHGVQDGAIVADCHQYNPVADTWFSLQNAVEARYRVGSGVSPFTVVGGMRIEAKDPQSLAVVERWGEIPTDDDTIDDDVADDDVVDDDTDVDDDLIDDDLSDDDAADDDAIDDDASDDDMQADDADDNGCGC